MPFYFALPSTNATRPRQVVRAAELGMCFGVRDALAVLRGIAAPTQVTVHGELVHNPQVLAELQGRGFRQTPEHHRPVPATPQVLVTAHGISERERTRLLAAGKQLLDTTCPLVRKAHDAAQALRAEGRRVVVLGRHGHVEVRGLVEDLPDGIVVETVADVRSWPETRLGVVCQTTTQEETAAELLAAIRAANPHADIAVRDTICSPTRARVQALVELLPQVDGLVVVGGRGSNNTRQLVLRAAAVVPVLAVEHAGELQPPWFAGKRRIGLTAGTSTPDAVVDAVHAALLALP